MSKHSFSCPQEEKVPLKRCPACGQFLKWNDYYGKYNYHVMYDSYTDSWEFTCGQSD